MRQGLINARRITLTLLILSAFNIIISLAIFIQDRIQSKALEQFCTILDSSSCHRVHNTFWGQPFGIELSLIGIILFSIYLCIVAAEFWKTTRIRRLLTIIGGISAGLGGVFFIFIQAFVIKMYCTYCLVVDSASILILILSVMLIYKKK